MAGGALDEGGIGEIDIFGHRNAERLARDGVLHRPMEEPADRREMARGGGDRNEARERDGQGGRDAGGEKAGDPLPGEGEGDPLLHAFAPSPDRMLGTMRPEMARAPVRWERPPTRIMASAPSRCSSSPEGASIRTQSSEQA